MLFAGIPFLRSINTITIGAVVAVAGMWVKRYLIIIPTLETPLLPMQDTRQAYIHYSMTWVEWALTFAGIATFFLFFMLFTRFMPILPASDLAETHEKQELISEKL
jgi:Ni/Fe-hydrogenase subunit HybB-like protein